MTATTGRSIVGLLLVFLISWTSAVAGEREDALRQLGIRMWTMETAVWMAKNEATVLHAFVQVPDDLWAYAIPAFVEAGSDPNARDKHGHTPLHHAARFGRPEIIGMLVDVGANVDPKGPKGRTPLHFAARAGHVTVIEALVKVGAKVNARAKKMADMTPLHVAAHMGYPAAVKALIHAGADPMARALGTVTPLDAARTQRNKTEGDVRGHYEVIKILTQMEIKIRETLNPSRRPMPRRRAKPPLRIQPL